MTSLSSILRVSFALLSLGLTPMTMATAQSTGAATGQTALSQRSIDTVPPKTVVETQFTITSGTLTLPGTLTVPASAGAKRSATGKKLPVKVSKKLPVALIVAGSGPTDRNGNSAGPLRAQNNSNLYAILAWQLAEAGIATVRYDKRVIGDNLQKVDIPSTSIDDFIADAIAGARKLVADPRFSKVILIGHSEGAELVLQAVNRGAPAAGIVMMSGAGRPIMPVLREQISKQLPPAEIAKWDSASARYLRGEDPGDVHPGLKSLLQPANRKFMQSWAKYDPAAEIAKVKVPVLIIQGGHDIQISEADARALKAAQPAAKLVVIPAANHVYRATTTDDRIAQMKLYVDPTIPIVPELTPAIADWIKSLK